MNTSLWNMDSGLAAVRRPGMINGVPGVGIGPSVRAGRQVQAIAQLLAGLEKRHMLFGDLDAVAGARIAAHPGIAALDREGAETAQLDPVAAGQGGGDLVKDRGDDDLDVTLIEVRICLGKPLHELRFGHGRACWQVNRRVRCQTHPPASSNGRGAKGAAVRRQAPTRATRAPSPQVGEGYQEATVWRTP